MTYEEKLEQTSINIVRGLCTFPDAGFDEKVNFVKGMMKGAGLVKEGEIIAKQVTGQMNLTDYFPDNELASEEDGRLAAEYLRYRMKSAISRQDIPELEAIAVDSRELAGRYPDFKSSFDDITVEVDGAILSIDERNI